MTPTPELMEKIREAIETVQYGKVSVSISEKGSFVEITIERKVRYEKE